MSKAQQPPHEAKRLQSLLDLAVLDTDAEHEFDALVHVAAAVCGVPISLISLVDADRQWFKANFGLPQATQTPREVAFCAHTILEDGIFEVPDATLDPRFLDNPLVTGAPDIRFYAGAPLQLSDGTNAGTLCVIDRQPRQLNDEQRKILSFLAIAASKALEGRRALLVEREMRVAAAQAAAAFRHSLDAILTLTLHGHVTHWNAAAEQLFGYTAEEMLGQSVTRLEPPDFALRNSDVEERLEGAKSGSVYTTQLLHRNGESIDVSISLAPITGDEGQLIGAIKIIRDVREQVRAANIVAQSEARFRALSESSPLGVFATDSSGACSYTNVRAQEIHGLTFAQMLGNGWISTIHPEDRSATFAEWERLTSIRAVFDREFRILRPLGDVRLLHVRAQAINNADGSPGGYVGSEEDITERKLAHDALVKSEELLNDTGAIAQVGGWELHIASGLLTWSEQTCRIHGVEPGYQPVLEKAIEFYAPEARPLIESAVAKGMVDGRTWDLELPFIQLGGQKIWVRAVGRAVFEDGKPVRLLGAFQDISQAVQSRQALASLHERLSVATQSGGIGVWDLNLQTGALTWDAQMYALYGLPQGLSTDDSTLWTRHLHPEDRNRAHSEFQAAVDRGTGFDSEFRVVWSDGSLHFLRSCGRITRDSAGLAVRVVGVNWDVTPMRQLANELAKQHELMRVTLQSIGDAVITTDGTGDVTWLNPVAERMTGWLNSEAKGKPVGQVFHIVNEATRAPTENPVFTCMQQGKIAGLANHTVLISRDGVEFGIEDSAAPIRNESGEILGVVLVFHDVTEQRRLSGEMTYRAKHDALTGLINRAEFETRLRNLLDKVHEDRSAHALLFIDLDQFKLVNDACGHSAGDQLLQQVSKLLGEVVRARDTLARLGGDEFAVLLEHCSAEQAQRVAQQICERMDDFRFLHDDKRFRIGASIGLVPVDNRWGTMAAVLQAADTSCYAAKEAGRNRVHTWSDTDQAMRARHGEMQWAARLEQALDENRFVLYAQRIFSLDQGAHGLYAEVLLRMMDSDGIVIPPGSFLPAAERFHFASRIDRWVLHNAVDVLRKLTTLSNIDTLCVNLSGQSIGDRAFHRQALETLQEAGDEVCRRLCLEITETAAVTNMADASVFVEQVRALGVRIALDDFGAGASSFGYLKNLNVDILKIDGQFIRDLIDDPLDDAAVRCFVDVARVVGVKTVAEYVDRTEVLNRVREIGIDFAQGFLLHRPEPIETVLSCAPQLHEVLQS